MYTDPIADFLTRIRNASSVKKPIVSMPSSKMKIGLAKVLKDMGYILDYKVESDNKQDILMLALKYDAVTKQPAITKLERISRPGLRAYAPVSKMPRVINNLGIAILTTSKGILTNHQAKALNVGGEVLCYIY